MTLQALIESTTRFSLRGSKSQAHYQIEEKLWPVQVDEGQFNRVFHNIILNADQAMPEGGTVTIAARNVGEDESKPVTLPAGRYVSVRISDEGVGIPAEHFDKIFDPYFSTKTEGSGLGLAVAHSIVQNHGGEIIVKSRVGRGTSFEVWIPACTDEPASSTKSPPRDTPARFKVLILEDDPAVAQVIERQLARLGGDVTLTRGGEATVRAFRAATQAKAPYDLLILDLTIPGGFGGKAVAAELRGSKGATKFVVSSGYSHDPVMSQFRDHGFDGVLQKPYTLAELSALIQSLL